MRRRSFLIAATLIPCRGLPAFGQICPPEAELDPRTLLKGTEIFTVQRFANLSYADGFTGPADAEGEWPAEMGWQGDRIDVRFTLPSSPPADTACYRLAIRVSHRFAQSIDLAISAGPSQEELAQVRVTPVAGPQQVVALIPPCRFKAGRPNWIRLKGVGVRTGAGNPAGIRWDSWALHRLEPTTTDEIRLDQLRRLTAFTLAAIQPSGLVRDALTLSPGDAPYHPATPDAAGFAVVALCAAHELGFLPDAARRVEAILSAYAGQTPGVSPQRSADGHFTHFMNVSTGEWAGRPWEDVYTPIGSALLVAGARFARNHFSGDAAVARLADRLANSIDFDAAIHPSLDGRIALGMAAKGGPSEAVGYTRPWNEFMLVVSMALRQAAAPRARGMAPLWLDPSRLPTVSRGGVRTLTDNPPLFAPAFWTHQMHFLNPDFAGNEQFATLLRNQQRADRAYCSAELRERFRYGLTAGQNPEGYGADRIRDHQHVFAPGAVAAWGDIETLLEFYRGQPPYADARYRYGLVRVSSRQPAWVPRETGLVDHLYLMFGLMESLHPKFFVERLVEPSLRPTRAVPVSQPAR